MGIYLPHMEMPTSCGFCPLENHTDYGYECCINRCLTEYQKRPDDCPLVSVPPHGRLGDLDALHKLFLEKGKKYKGFGGAMVAAAAWCIANAPTIIPAEGGNAK